LQYELNLQEYRLHSIIPFSDLKEALLVIEGIKSNTQMLNRQINSVEIIKNTEGDTLLSIENTIYPYSLEEMLLSNEAYFFEKNLVVQKILLSTDDSKTLFHLQYSLINSCVEESNLGLIKNQHSYIPGAFGISILKNTETVTQKKTSKTISNTGYKKIGSINLENKTNIQYYRNFEGKIITIED
ncbi:MAG TPA: hypothetical protein VJ861_09475, partial [Treponemataceae bacterium]|nr:hypothetical protein [Treponemataceae bacterium]